MSMSGKKSILFVDDDKDELQRWTPYLEAHGFDVRTATTVQEAQTLAAQFKFDVAVLDIELPYYDPDGPKQRVAGFHLGERLQRLYGVTGVVYITQYLQDPETKARLKQMTESAHLGKIVTYINRKKVNREELKKIGAFVRDFMYKVESAQMQAIEGDLKTNRSAESSTSVDGIVIHTMMTSMGEVKLRCIEDDVYLYIDEIFQCKFSGKQANFLRILGEEYANTKYVAVKYLMAEIWGTIKGENNLHKLVSLVRERMLKVAGKSIIVTELNKQGMALGYSIARAGAEDDS